MNGRGRGAALAAAWVLVALLISGGAAGVVTAMDRAPGADARPELTWAGDRAAGNLLRMAEADLVALAADVEALGVQARGALAALSGQDLDTVQAAVDRGTTLVVGIRERSASIRADLDAVPGVTGPEAPLVTSDAVRARHTSMLAALDATEGLDEAWARLTVGSLAAARLSDQLSEHDRLMAEAAEAGRDGRFEDGVARIAAAEAVLDDAARTSDRLRPTVDVEVLDEWIRRHRRYDQALAALYEALRDANGVVDADVREAAAAEERASAGLPPDARGLVVIMGDIGRGGLNGAVITIEEARGRLAAAIDGLGAAAR